MTDTTDLAAWLRARFDEDERIARAAAEPESWIELNRHPRPEWHVQQWADPDCAAVVADPESSAYPVVTTTIGMDEADAEARAEHIARHDPARVLRAIEAKRALLDDLLAERHEVVGDSWYTCAAATEERDGGQTCDDDRRGGPCDCGRDGRVLRRLRLLAAEFADRPGCRDEWRP